MRRASFAAALAASLAIVSVAAQQPAPATTPAAPGASAVNLLPVQRAVSMIVTAAGNTAVQVGDDGPLLVDAPAPAQAGAVVAAVRALTPRPIHTVVTTSLHSAPGNGALLQARGTAPGVPAVRVIAFESVLDRLVAAGPSSGAPAAGIRLNQVIELPINNTYFRSRRDFFLNGESVIVHHAPNAHTDGDSIVHFRRSDVVAVGDLFNPDVYPVIDVANGGSVNGLVDALNQILELTVPAKFQEGGTYVIPRHGRLCDEADVVEFRDMVTIVRDRVQDLIKKGRTLEQVKAARPTLDYDPEYGGTGDASPDRFVESIFRSLTK